MKRGLFLTCLLLSQAVFASNDVANTVTQNTVSQSTAAFSTGIGTAKDWGLTEAEWNRYLVLMRGAAGRYYAHLTPLEVLGHYADTDADLRHFAEAYAKVEHEKVEREIRFNKAFQDAAARLYTDEPVIKAFDITPYTPVPKFSHHSSSALKSGDHLVLFIDVKDGLSQTKMTHLVDQVKTNPGVILDVYLINASNPYTIRQWARTNNIPIDLVARSKITLNEDEGRFRDTAGDVSPPYLVLVRQGKSRAIAMDAL